MKRSEKMGGRSRDQRLHRGYEYSCAAEIKERELEARRWCGQKTLASAALSRKWAPCLTNVA